MKKITTLVLFAAAAAACGDNTDPPGPPVDSSMDAAPARIRAVVVTPSNNFAPGQPGILSTVDVRDKAVTMGAGPAMAVGSDPILRKIGDELFIINRAENNITILDAEDLHLVEQISTGMNSNPQDVAVIGDKLYVPTLGNKGMVELVRGSNAIIEYDLSVDDPDGKPNCSSIFYVNSDLYVACGLLDNSDMFLPPRGNAKVYLVDPATRMIRRTVTLTTKNPIGLIEQIPEFAPNAGDLVVPTIEFATGSGCVERITLGSTAASGGCLVQNTTLGNFASRVGFYAVEFTGPVAPHIVVPPMMYVSVPDAADFTKAALRGFDLGTSMLLDTKSPAAQAIGDLAVCPDSHIVVADTTMAANGVRIYQGTSEVTTAVLPVGLRPQSAHGIVCY